MRTNLLYIFYINKKVFVLNECYVRTLGWDDNESLLIKNEQCWKNESLLTKNLGSNSTMLNLLREHFIIQCDPILVEGLIFTDDI